MTNRLVQARNAGEDKTPDHAAFEHLFERLVAICNRLDKARDELNKLVRQEVQAARRFVAMVMLALLGVVATGAATWLTLAMQATG